MICMYWCFCVHACQERMDAEGLSAAFFGQEMAMVCVVVSISRAYDKRVNVLQFWSFREKHNAQIQKASMQTSKYTAGADPGAHAN